MIITGLRIKNFGKFSDLSVEFEDNLNVIHGDNEAGKTTVIAFIKAMLYGMSSRKRDIRANDRLRYQPWNGNFGEGELLFKNGKGRVHLIKRKLNNDRHDINVSDALTGRRIAKYETANPGELLLGLTESAYTRTIYIPQLGSMISSHKDDEIMSRLVNLQDTGEEQVSLQKALNIIEKERKRITIRSGSGKLDSLHDVQFKLRNELRNVQKLHDENIEDQRQLNHLQAQKLELEQAICGWEEVRKGLKKRKIFLEYLELVKLQDELDHLQDDLKEINKQLLCGESAVDGQFLKNLQTSLIDRQNNVKELRVLENEIREKSAELEKAVKGLQEFSGFQELDNDVVTQVLLKEKNTEILTAKLFLYEQIHQEIEELEKVLAAKKTELGPLYVFYDLSPEEEEEIAHKEELKKKLEEEQKNDIQVDTLRRDIIRDKLKNIQILKALGIAAVTAGVITGTLYNPLFYFASLLGAITAIYAFTYAKKQKTALAEIEGRISDYRGEGLKRRLDSLTADLSVFYRRYGASDNQEFTALRRRFELMQSDIAHIKSKISDRMGRCNAEEEEKLQKQLKECTAYLQNILITTGCKSLDDFNEKYKAFSNNKSLCENLTKEFEILKSKYNTLSSVIENIEDRIFAKLCLEPGKDSVDKADILIKEYEKSLDRRKGLIIRIETNAKNLNERLAGRKLADLSAAVADYKAQGDNWTHAEEENIVKKLHELNEERLEAVRKITALESSVANRFKDSRDISLIEEQLESVGLEIKRLEEILDVLELTKNMLIESYEELQNSFGPILNERVGSVLKKITRGKYNDVKIGDAYRITVKDKTDWPRELEFFSSGTLDQVYFALRLGIIELAFEKERKLPLILDDTFVQYDEVRLAAVLDYLLEYAQNHQILLFTCHRREAEYLRDREFKYINLKT